MKDVQILKELALRLFEAGFLQFGSFPFKIHERFPDFPMSPNRVNLRTPKNGGNMTPELILAIAREIKKKVVRVNFDLIAGLPTAGVPFAEVLAKCLNMPLLKLAKKNLPGGKRCIGGIISGQHKKGQRVLILDDVFSQADTKREGIAQFIDAGLRIAAIVAVVDREEGGSEYLQELGYRVYWIFALSWLFNLYYDADKITREQMDKSLAYSQLAKKFFFQNLY